MELFIRLTRTKIKHCFVRARFVLFGPKLGQDVINKKFLNLGVGTIVDKNCGHYLVRFDSDVLNMLASVDKTMWLNKNMLLPYICDK